MSGFRQQNYELSSAPFVPLRDAPPPKETKPQKKQPTKKKLSKETLLEQEYLPVQENGKVEVEKFVAIGTVTSNPDKKLWLEWVLKPGKKPWKHNDSYSVQEFANKTQDAQKEDIANEAISFLKDRSKWSYHPPVAMNALHIIRHLLGHAPVCTPIFEKEKPLFQTLIDDEDLPYGKELLKGILQLLTPPSKARAMTDLLDLPVAESPTNIFKNLKIKQNPLLTPQNKPQVELKPKTDSGTCSVPAISSLENNNRWTYLDLVFSTIPTTTEPEDDKFGFVKDHLS